MKYGGKENEKIVTIARAPNAMSNFHALSLILTARQACRTKVYELSN